MAKSDVFQGKLFSGFETGDDCSDDDFEHLDMLYSGPPNGNDIKADGIFGRHRNSAGLGVRPIILDSSEVTLGLHRTTCMLS